jgi:hypothetical protein
MTREAAEFIAARLPGAWISRTSQGWVVWLSCLGVVDMKFGAITGIDFFTCGKIPGNKELLVHMTECLEQFESAIADARAAGLLPQEGKDGNACGT